MTRWLLLAWLAGVVAGGCENQPVPRLTEDSHTEARFERMREKMVRTQIQGRGVRDARVLAALRKVPRHRFVPPHLVARAYEDGALPIGEEQTISQPYIVALMTEMVHLSETDRVLEVGTGSGYQAAVLAELASRVYTIEILEPLARTAEERLRSLGYENVEVRCGDGYRGWPEAAPFDAVVVTAAPDHIPPALVEQLRVGGRMAIPVGRGEQELLLLVKEAGGVREEGVIPVRFVPMTGAAERR